MEQGRAAHRTDGRPADRRGRGTRRRTDPCARPAQDRGCLYQPRLAGGADEHPGWYLWRDGIIPGDAAHPGETVGQVGARADAVLSRVRPLLGAGDVALVAHGHILRVLTARWLGLEPADGRLFRLDTGTLCTLGTEHDMPVIQSWNVPATS